MMVWMRCAMMRSVLSPNSSAIVFWMRASVSRSTLAVASSKHTTLASFTSARASETRLRSPTDL